jgi:hypothetical protein
MPQVLFKLLLVWGMVTLLSSLPASANIRYDGTAEELSSEKNPGNQNVGLGDADYPVRNPSPAKMLQLTGSLPASLKIELYASFAAWPNAVRRDSVDVNCEYQSTSLATHEYSVVEPLAISRRGDLYQVSISMDKYLPGRCGWHLRSLEYGLLNGIGGRSAARIATVYYTEQPLPDSAELYRGDVNVWCKRNPYPPDPSRPMNCGTLSALENAFFVNPALMKSIPSDQRGKQTQMWIFPETNTVVVNFRDLDAVQGSKHGQ